MKTGKMTVGLLMGVLLLAVFMFARAEAGEKSIYNASEAAYQGILTYYSSMTGLENAGDGNPMDYKERASFLKENKEIIVSRIAGMNASGHLGDAHRVFENIYDSRLAYHPYTKDMSRCTAKEYIDTGTGYRYIRKGPDSYAEYSKRGKYLRDVADDLPLLTRSLRVMPIDYRSCYVLYEKYMDGQKVYLSLPATEEHPKNGWEAEKVLTAAR